MSIANPSLNQEVIDTLFVMFKLSIKCWKLMVTGELEWQCNEQTSWRDE